MNNNNKQTKGSIGVGIVIGIAFIFAAIGMSLNFPPPFSYSLWLVPLLYLGLLIYFFKSGKKFTGIGMLIILGIALLLTAACFGLMYQL